jgi:signal transduction histidine kinase
MRLTLLYTGLFLVSGVLLLAITNVGARSDTSVVPFVKVDPVAPVVKIPAFDPEDPGLDRLAVSSALALAVMSVISLGLGWIVAGRALRPLRTITATAREISATNLHERLDLEGPDDEVKELGETLDELFGRLEASFDSQRHFVANASHELRTPLTVERTLLQVALADPDADVTTLRAACEDVLEVGAQQERLIGSLLTLATSERGLEEREPFALDEVVAQVVASRHESAEQRGVRVDTTIIEVHALGDVRLVESLVTNLVDNALHHNVAEGRVEVSTASVAGGATLAVRNTGPVIPPMDVDRLFEPFQRLGNERVGADGHGLGLAIVRAIADAHGATLTARARPEGGLDVEVRFPAVAPMPGALA